MKTKLLLMSLFIITGIEISQASVINANGTHTSTLQGLAIDDNTFDLKLNAKNSSIELSSLKQLKQRFYYPLFSSEIVNIQEQDQKERFEISPNPARTKLNINLSKSLDNATVTVYDVLGKKVYSKELNGLESSIDVSSWNAGIYLVRISTERETLTKRFVKQ